eukprot:SAG31_NODE_1366_length_8621_cov_4.579911_2_plen_99_part_00
MEETTRSARRDKPYVKVRFEELLDLIRTGPIPSNGREIELEGVSAGPHERPGWDKVLFLAGILRKRTRRTSKSTQVDSMAALALRECIAELAAAEWCA